MTSRFRLNQFNRSYFKDYTLYSQFVRYITIKILTEVITSLRNLEQFRVSNT